MPRSFDRPDEPGCAAAAVRLLHPCLRPDQAEAFLDQLDCDDLDGDGEHHGEDASEDVDQPASAGVGLGGQPERLLRLARCLDEDYDRHHPGAAADRRPRGQAERAWLAAMTPRQRRRQRRWMVYAVCLQARPWWWTPGDYTYRAWYRAIS